MVLLATVVAVIQFQIQPPTSAAFDASSEGECYYYTQIECGWG